MGKNTDKLFVTHSEWSGNDLHSASGGKVNNSTKLALSKQATALPFWTCSVSQQPIDPGCGVCDPEGHVFDIKNVMPFIMRQGLNPVTGKPLARTDLIKLKPTTDENEESGPGGPVYVDPVTLKQFQRLTEAVVIRPTGQVYFASTVRDMCLKPGNLIDLVTDEPFKKEDVIKLKGGVGVLQKSEAMLKREREEQQVQDQKRKRLRQEQHTEEDIDDNSKALSKTHTTHHMASSATSTAISLNTSSKFETIPLEQLLRPKRFLGPGYVVIETNFGELNVELYSKYSPKAVYNFIYLARQGYYNGTIFHRNIKNFMIQGGDPTGTGRGSPDTTRTAFGNQPFKDETNSPYKFDARGLLAMANKGKNTNTSQFFITYGSPLSHLDGKHTIFGKVVGGLGVLDEMERVPVGSADRPRKRIEIIDVRVLVDPFDEDEKPKSGNLQEDDSPWLKKSTVTGSSAIGKYLKSNATSSIDPATTIPVGAGEEESNWKTRQKKKTSITKSSFSGW